MKKRRFARLEETKRWFAVEKKRSVRTKIVIKGKTE